VYEPGVDRKAQAGDVVVDADGEMPARSVGRQVVEDRLEHRRRDLLGGQPVPAARHPRRPLERRRVGVHGLVDGGEHRQVERLADRARLLRAVEYRDRTRRRWQRRDESLAGKRLEQPHLHHADPLPRRVQVVDRLLERAGGRAHDHDDAVGVDGAVVLDHPVPTPGPRRELVERFGDDARHREVERVGGLAGLEEHVGVLRGAPYDGRFGCHPPGPEGDDVVVADQRGDVVVGQRRDLVDLVRGAEPVEEVQERHPRPQGGDVGHEREVLRLLHRSRRQHRPPGRPRVHDVAVVPEDRQGMGRDGARRDVDDGRGQLAGDLEHVRDHQQQALRGRERRRQGALLQRAVQRACGAGLGLHLHNIGNDAPEVRAACRRPIVAVLAHRRRGRDRVQRDDLAQRVCHPSRGLVPIDTTPFVGHAITPASPPIPDDATHALTRRPSGAVPVIRLPR
jgi:hypothetical protein